MEKSLEIISICKHEEKLALFFSKNKLISLLANYVDLWQNLAFLLSIILNFLIISAFSVNEVNDSKKTRLDEYSLGNLSR